MVNRISAQAVVPFRFAAFLVGRKFGPRTGRVLCVTNPMGYSTTRVDRTQAFLMACRLMRAVVVLVLLFAFGFAQTAFAQSTLTLSSNHFVTGNYVVGGVGLRGLG